MFHYNRVWCVSPVASAENLAEKLTTVTWCCCTGFECGGYFFLNDATSPDGAQEYAILKHDGDRLLQIESITFGWCATAPALNFLRDVLAGRDDRGPFAQEVEAVLETPAQHGRCRHCA